MWNTLILIGFGLVAISAVFLVVIFWRAWGDEEFRADKRYRVVSASLAIGKVGIFMWALNPLIQAAGGEGLPLPAMIVASVLILAAAVSLIGSTAMGGDKRTLLFFGCAAAAWTAGCILYGAIA